MGTYIHKDSVRRWKQILSKHDYILCPLVLHKMVFKLGLHSGLDIGFVFCIIYLDLTRKSTLFLLTFSSIYLLFFIHLSKNEACPVLIWLWFRDAEYLVWLEIRITDGAFYGDLVWFLITETQYFLEWTSGVLIWEKY